MIKAKSMQTSGVLRQLQDQLKREYLLLQRQQREKSKIKKQIQHSIQEYYSVLVEKKGLGSVIVEDKLGNSYNFVKDLVLSISRDVTFGFQLLIHCNYPTVGELSTLLLGMFYDNLSENDPYLKKNIKFSQLLGKKICIQLMEQNFIRKQEDIVLSKELLSANIKHILKQYLRLQSIRQYFEMLANRVLHKIPHSIRFENHHIRRGSVCSPQLQKSIIDLNQSQTITARGSSSSMHEYEIQTKISQAVQQYKNDILSKAQMMPICLRILCYSIMSELLETKKVKQDKISKFIWQILQQEYFKPFQCTHNTRKWNHFKNSHFNQTVHRVVEMMSRKVDNKFIQKLVQKVINISKDKLNRKEDETRKKIVINGGCVSYRNLYYLLIVIKQNQKHLKNLNQRAVNRVNKISQMNPQFEFFKTFNNPSTSYLVFTELIYGEIIQKDYQGIYLNVYKDNMIKNMLKQILSDINFHILPYIEKESTLEDILEKIIREQEVQRDGNFSLGVLQHSPQFNMKIKYLLYLMRKEIDQEAIFQQMVEECLERQKENIILFEKNKIQLLQCLTTVNKAKKLVKSQKQAEKNVDSHLKIVKILDTMDINLCITSPSTRPEKEKYTKTTNQRIVIQNSHNCPHQQNIQQGLKHHANNVLQAIIIFCELKQVKMAMDTGKDSYKIYESLCFLIDHLKEQCRNHYNVNMEEYNYFEISVFKVVMREIHELLVEDKQKSVAELEFQKILKDLSFIKPNKIKIPGRQNLAQLEQVWEIVCRYLKNLNQKKSPSDKIQSILEMIEIIKISLQHDGLDKDEGFDKHSTEIILAYCLIRARPEKMLLNINFIELFLSKDKLLAKEGAALKKLQNAVALLRQNKLIDSLINDDIEFEQKLFQNKTAMAVQNMKQTQKVTSMIAYI